MTDIKKIYVGQGKTIETKYGELLKLSLHKDDLEKLIAALDKGWVNVIVNKRREKSEKGFTHYLVVDTWKPTKKTRENPAKNSAPNNDGDMLKEDLPF